MARPRGGSAWIAAAAPFVAAIVAGVYVCNAGRDGGEEVRPKPAAVKAGEPTAEEVPNEHARAVEAAKVASQREADLWRELRLLRTCLSSADIELRELRESYRASLVDGAPAKPIDRVYRISRDNLQSCDTSLSGIEGPGAIAAARYREMIAALLPPILVLRDYHNERDFLEDDFAVARAQHPAVAAGFDRFDEASRALRVRATAIREELRSMLPGTPRDLVAELYLAVLELDDRMTANAADDELAASLAAIDAIRAEARRVVADLAGSTRANALDNALGDSSGALREIKGQIRARRKDAARILKPTSFRALEYDVMRGR